MNKTAIRSALFRGGRMFVLAFVAASTTGLSVLQEQMFMKDGAPNSKAALAAASTAFLVAFASSVLHLIEESFSNSSEVPQVPPAPQVKK